MYNVGLFSLLFIFSSCNESLLDIPQMATKSEDNFYKTDDNAEAAVTAVYSAWRVASCGNSWAITYNCGFLLKNMLADEMRFGGSSRLDNTGLQECSESIITTTNEPIRYYYQSLYKVIYLCNIMMEKFDASESRVKARAIAEAKFFRAYCNFELVTLWGTAPLVDHVLTPSEYETPNSTVDALWAFIEEDLNVAISSGTLPSKTSIDDRNTGFRITKETANAYLGRALLYLYQGKYSEAESHFDFMPAQGYGFFHPTKSLYDAFVAEEGEEGYRLNNSVLTWDKVVAMNIYATQNRSLYGHEGYFRLKWLATDAVAYVDNENPLSGWTSGRDGLLRFPQKELEVNGNLVQNPGYSE